MKDSIITISASELEPLAIDTFRKSCPNYCPDYGELKCCGDAICGNTCVYITHFKLKFKEELAVRELKKQIEIEQKS